MQPVAIVFLVNVVLFVICTVKAVKKHQNKGTSLTFYLAILLFALVLINLCSAIDGFFFGTLYFLPYGYAISVFLAAISTISLMLLAIDAFFAEDKPVYSPRLNAFRLNYAIYIIIICIWSGVELIYNPKASTTPSLIVMFISNQFIYVILIVKSFRLARNVEDKVYSRPILFIAYFSIANLIKYFFFVIESVNNAEQGTTIWSFLAACIFGYTAFLAYVAFLKTVKKE